MKKINKKAFTLIELLVVILIIGILAAIAVPQYQKAVAKAELAQIISAVKSLKRAQEVYFLSKGEYANSINLLDISINDENTSCQLTTGQYNYVQCYNKNFSLVAYVNKPAIECAAKTQDTNSALAYACRDFTKSTSGVYDMGVCHVLMRPCAISFAQFAF